MNVFTIPTPTVTLPVTPSPPLPAPPHPARPPQGPSPTNRLAIPLPTRPATPRGQRAGGVGEAFGLHLRYS